MIEDVVL